MLVDVVFVSGLLLVCSLGVGALPLFWTSSYRRLWLTAGVGLLIGTTFGVTLPEGLHAMYQQKRTTMTPAQAHDRIFTPTDRPLPLALPGVLEPHPAPGLTVAATWDPLGVITRSSPLSSVAAATPSESAHQKSLAQFRVDRERPATFKPLVPTRGAAAATTTSAAPKEQGHALGHAHAHGEGGAHRRLLGTSGVAHDDHMDDHSGHDHSAHAHATPASIKGEALPNLGGSSLPSAQNLQQMFTEKVTSLLRTPTLPLSSSRFVDEEAAAAAHSAYTHTHAASASSASSEPSFLDGAISAIESPASVVSSALIVCFPETHGSKRMGMALAFGFVFMILLDRLFAARSRPTESCDVAQPPSSTSRNPSIELNSRRGLAASTSGLSSPELRNPTLPSTTPRIAAQSAPHTAVTILSPSFPAHPREAHSHAGHSHGPGGANSSSTSVAASRSTTKQFDATTLAVLLGPFIHALVDGFTLGAVGVRANAVASSSLLMSILLHKAPLALGVTSFLLFLGKQHADVVRYLFVYSVAAPLAAVLMCVLAGDTDPLASGDGSAPGLWMLFASGCVLFTIAVHILPEIQAQHASAAKSRPEESARGHGHATLNSPARSATPPILPPRRTSVATEEVESKSIPWRFVWALIVGLCLPLFFSYVQVRKPLLQ